MKNFESPSENSVGEQQDERSERFLSKIKGFKERIAQRLGVKGEKLTAFTDEALVDDVHETISRADEDGTRTEEEKAEIIEAVSSVVVQGAIEQAGYDQSTGENPILSLNNEATSEELISSIAALHEDDATLPTGESVAELAVEVIEAAKWDHMRKVGGQLGSNEGGWYENPDTGERFYVKFYENPSQGRVEYIANAVYAKLGIKAVKSQIVQMGGREAIASPAVKGAEETSMQQQHDSEDVRKGFVADAFLANWDVVGLVFDNVVRGADGGMYRIDNGGSLIFRAQGGDKAYSPDDIPELQSMLNPNFPAGRVFKGITKEEIVAQARHLLDSLSEEDIREIVEKSGLEGKERERVLTGMLGRRRFLERLVTEAESAKPGEQAEASASKEYPVDPEPDEELIDDEETEQPPKPRLAEVLRQVREASSETVGDYTVFPRKEVTCDFDHIEDQKIDVYNQEGLNTTVLSFKLRRGHRELYERIRAREDAYDDWPIEFTYKKAGEAKAVPFVKAVSFERGGVTVFIANPDTSKRTAHGLIRIEVPSDMDPEEAEAIIAQIMAEDLAIQNGLDEPTEMAENQYKEARYKWEHKVEGELTPQQKERISRMRSKEVAPGYTTYVEPGRHKEYERRYGEIVPYHTISVSSPEQIASLLINGLLSTKERCTRGLDTRGMGLSPGEDLETGGGDSVFTRVARRDYLKQLGPGIVVTFKPELLDRTDWYIFDHDDYGSTKPEAMAGRLSPDEALAMVADGTLSPTNEQMFRNSIGPEYIDTISVPMEMRDKVLAILRERGITEIGGKPIEEIVIGVESKHGETNDI